MQVKTSHIVIKHEVWCIDMLVFWISSAGGRLENYQTTIPNFYSCKEDWLEVS